MTPPDDSLFCFDTANTLLAEGGIGFSIAAIVIILALTLNTILDEVSKKREKARPSPLGGGGWNVHESKAQPDDGTENPPLGTVKENRGFFPAKPWRIGEVRRRNGPSNKENGTV